MRAPPECRYDQRASLCAVESKISSEFIKKHKAVNVDRYVSLKAAGSSVKIVV